MQITGRQPYEWLPPLLTTPYHTLANIEHCMLHLKQVNGVALENVIVVIEYPRKSPGNLYSQNFETCLTNIPVPE